MAQKKKKVSSAKSSGKVIYTTTSKKAAKKKSSKSTKLHAQRTDSKPLWKHQKLTIAKYKKSDRIFDTSDPGTGKTRAHLVAFETRRKKGGGCALVVAPKSLLETAWQDDAVEFAPSLTSSVAYADCRQSAFDVNADIYITNTDAVKWLARQPAKFFAKFDTVIIDESTTFKHRTSQRSKALIKIKSHFQYRIMMTGTPNSGTILDVWNQALFLDDGVRLGANFFGFRQSVCVPEQIGPRANMLQWVDKDGAEEAVAGLLADITIRHEFDKCMDIPPNHSYNIKFKPSHKLKAAYDEMELTAILETEKGDITAVNAAVLRNKLLQISSGAVYNGEGGYKLLGTERYELVCDLIQQREHSVVFFNWKHQKVELTKMADKRGIKYEVLDGDTPIKRRKAIVQAYQAGFYDTIFLHPQTGAHGLTLTRGTATIWTSPIYQPDFLKQGLHRIWRGGQKLPTETIMIEAEGTVEHKVFNRLNAKNARMVNLLDLFAGD